MSCSQVTLTYSLIDDDFSASINLTQLGTYNGLPYYSYPLQGDPLDIYYIYYDLASNKWVTWSTLGLPYQPGASAFLTNTTGCPLGIWTIENPKFLSFQISPYYNPLYNRTITYDPNSTGWTSFWSYIPDWMIGMNNVFYTWNNGNLYKHDVNTIRNRFYGFNYPSTITTVFNQDPLEVKMFKTMAIESNEPWDVDLETDLNTGMIDGSYFLDKEGTWFAHIRRDPNEIDLKAVSTQGIGALQSFASPVLTFAFNIGTTISQGDKVYKVVSGSLVLVGTVASHTSTTITLVSVASAPAPGDIIVYVKDSTAESFGARGYYMQALLTNNSTSHVEIFNVNVNSFKSNP